MLLCYAMLCYAMLCYAMLCYAIKCNTMLFCAMLYCAIVTGGSGRYSQEVCEKLDALQLGGIVHFGPAQVLEYLSDRTTTRTARQTARDKHS
jgi:hypothetical protein